MDKSDSSHEQVCDPVTGKTGPTRPTQAPAQGERAQAVPDAVVASEGASSSATAQEARVVEEVVPAKGWKSWRSTLPRWDGERVKSIAVRATKVAAIVFVAWFTVVLILIAVFRFVNPPASALMVLRWLGGTNISQQWVPLDRISPNLVRAVIVSEDGRFCQHWGIDPAAIKEAIERSKSWTPRGASTITMQVAKNLFLLPTKSYVRKALEVPITFAIEIAWPKQRILEVYLNIAEWGPGVFGAEAAARAHFKRSAKTLNAHQASRLAVALPSPMVRNPRKPGPWMSRQSSRIRARAARFRSATSCIYPDGR